MKLPNSNKELTPNHFWAILRITIGLIFLWAFMDKMLGLGYATCRTIDPTTKEETVKVLCEKSVAKGGSSAAGYLKNVPHGPFKEFYNKLAGNNLVDFLFMAGLLLVGLALLLGIGIKIATASGVLLLLMLWSTVLPQKNNPVLDEHIVYSIALLGVCSANSHQVWGLGKRWQKLAIVKKYPILI